MGSSNDGTLEDYKVSKKTGSTSTGGASGGGGEDECDKAFSATLQEVDRCTFFRTFGSLPPVNMDVTVILGSVSSGSVRLEVHAHSGELIGYLPTSLNYLAGCLNGGKNYAGVVSSVSTIPINKVDVDIHPV